MNSFQGVSHHHQWTSSSASQAAHQPLVGPKQGAVLLKQLANSYKRPAQPPRRGLRGGQSHPNKHYAGPPGPSPDPVLWFPGGDAECGVTEGASSSMSTFSIIALLLSVFNIIDMLVSNANNNNNRNNINQNDFNANDNSNTESNANPDQASSNAVMAVPPGAGRRKREAMEGRSVLRLENRSHWFRLTLEPEGGEAVQGAWYPTKRGRKGAQDEVMLATSAVLNGWVLAQEKGTEHCWRRNLCELGYNGAVWGRIGEAVVEMMESVVTRWLARSNEEEVELLEAARLGRQRGRAGGSRGGCEQSWTKECPVEEWNQLVNDTRAKVANMTSSFGHDMIQT